MYLCSVWDFARDLSVTQDVVSVTHVLMSVTLDEAAVTVIDHRPEWTTAITVGS